MTEIEAASFAQKTPFLSVERTLLHDKLLSKCNSKFIFGDEVNYLAQNERVVNVGFKNSPADCFDIVIGADGIYSRIRALCNNGIEINNLNAICWRMILDNKMRINQPRFYLGCGQFILLHPIDDNRIYCGAIAKNSELYQKSALENFRNVCADMSEPIKEYLYETASSNVELYEKNIESVSEIYWGESRVLLIGDAAHACAPAMQQGGALALEDAWLLSKCIGHSSSQILLDDIECFKLKRRDRVEFIYQNSNQFTRKMIDISGDKIQERKDIIKKYGLPNFNLWRKLFSIEI